MYWQTCQKQTACLRPSAPDTQHELLVPRPGNHRSLRGIPRARPVSGAMARPQPAVHGGAQFDGAVRLPPGRRLTPRGRQMRTGTIRYAQAAQCGGCSRLQPVRKSRAVVHASAW
ncbi:hypothetical protein GCM10023335_75120 [Streptomyces siamensis]|uniref:Uncharacterized protein n=1 Tax=Streptomyces siamensis TaxID=1274986 RepID=A0ABP9JK56_9ACTN